ncbi:MAG: hypothetical protein GWM98_18065 [Nitrospinaceae bacterium]|nr:hypothetical protein [Nitrospinaceae bacterium]NIR56050.1 hypothetical protein [Nitrospinaceae bacterium]NIS86495.1 hypothetical protein [Nitrospinaceae bacterium]NIT83330.1 hypothetical protein [Nitrospinaceae bacterium]NIU45539.1 hypothetical protein [Nitrospinaceae bacterium]
MKQNRQNGFDEFWKRIQNEIHSHPVITRNEYCKWFKKGEFNKKQLINLFEQFAVFSKWFLLVQMMRLLNASDLEAETHARYILANELGVGINPDGSTENQPFRTAWAHINWLRETARPLNLEPEHLGSWATASHGTREFIRGLEETYGSKDGQVGQGSSYAIETWAAWGIGKGKEAESNNFWMELITGIKEYNRKNRLTGDEMIPLDFFMFHFNSEKGHGDNVLDELRRSFMKPDFDEDKFIESGKKALEAIYTFWTDLENSRHHIDETRSRYAVFVGA